MARTSTVCGTFHATVLGIEPSKENLICWLSAQLAFTEQVVTHTSSCSVKERIPPVREVRVGSARTVTVTVSPTTGDAVSSTSYLSCLGNLSASACALVTPWLMGSNSMTLVEPSDSMMRTPT